MSQKQNDRAVGIVVSLFVGAMLLFILAMAFIPMPIVYSELAAHTPLFPKIVGLALWFVAGYIIYLMNIYKISNGPGILFLVFLFIALGMWAFIGFQT